MTKKLHFLKIKTKLIFHGNTSDFYNQMNYMRQGITFQLEGDAFSKSAQSTALILHEAMLILKFGRRNHRIKVIM